MREIFYPDSVAVIGVSNSPDNMAQWIVRNLTEFGFQGIIYEVGVKGGVYAGRRIYKSLLDIPDPIDLAVILTPARTVPGLLEDCGKKGIRRVVVETAGFREYGEEGKKIERDLVAVAAKYGIRFVGPNCIGVDQHGKRPLHPLPSPEKSRPARRYFHDLPERRGGHVRSQSHGKRGARAQ